MPFLDVRQIEPFEALPGCRLRTSHGKHLMLSYVEFDEGIIVPLHSHPHEQGGMVLKGTIEFTIGDETRRCEAGSMFLIPPNTPHKAAAVGGPAVALDVFSPIREDYAQRVNAYIPANDVPS